MHKKGQKLPFRIRYRYPGQKPGVIAKANFDEAERQAAEIGARGAEAALWFLRRGDATTTASAVSEVALARFGPAEAHTLLIPPTSGYAWECSCGRYALNVPSMTEHMDRIGRCSFCWALPVHRDGAEAECPACDGSGATEDEDYHDVDLAGYRPVSVYLG